MEPITNNLKLPPKGPPVKGGPTERGELLKEFCERVNAGRKGTKYQPYDIPRMAKQLEGINTQWLGYLMKICKGSRNFSATFFWRLKEEREELKRRGL